MLKTETLPAVADRTTQDVIRRSVEHVAIYAASGISDLQQLAESLRHEHPNIVVQKAGSSKPNAIDGAVLMETNPFFIYAYDATLGLWLGTEEKLASMAGVAPVPAGYRIENAYLGIVAAAAYTASVTLTDSAGATLATQAIAGGAGYTEVASALGITSVAAMAITYTVTGTSGITPAVLLWLTVRKIG